MDLGDALSLDSMPGLCFQHPSQRPEVASRNWLPICPSPPVVPPQSLPLAPSGVPHLDSPPVVVQVLNHLNSLAEKLKRRSNFPAAASCTGLQRQAVTSRAQVSDDARGGGSTGLRTARTPLPAGSVPGTETSELGKAFASEGVQSVARRLA